MVKTRGHSAEFLEQCRRSCPTQEDLVKWGVIKEVPRFEAKAMVEEAPVVLEEVPVVVKKRRGRPPGSKNKPKI
jgi:hypothetical protein